MAIYNLSNKSSENYMLSFVPTHLPSDYIEIGYLSLILLIGAPLNLYVFVKLLRETRKPFSKEPSLKTAFLRLKLNLNISDNIILLTHVVGKISWMSTYKWLGGGFLCRIYEFLSMFGFYISSNVIVCIALDRLITVIWPRRSIRLDPRRFVNLSLAIAWVMAFVCSTPQLLVWDTLNILPYTDTNWYQCTDIWTAKSFRTGSLSTRDLILQNAYNLSHLLFVFWLPFAILIISYSIITVKLIRYSNQKPSTSSGGKVVRGSYGPLTSAMGKESQQSDADNCQQQRKQLEKGNQITIRVTHATQIPLNESGKILTQTEAQAADKCIIDNRSETINQHGLSSSDPCSSTISPFAVESRNRTQSASTYKTVDSATTRIPTWRRQLRSRVFRTTVLVVIAYVVCWLPYNVIAILRIEYLSDHMNILKTLILVNSLINPFIYGFSFCKTKNT